jgi:SAM-dependent methyltransferase
MRLLCKRRPELSDTVAAFDASAEDYDRQFTATAIGSRMRAAVWSRCAVRFTPGSRVLDMNCGTGEDAIWLARRGLQVVAADISPRMLEIAEGKFASSANGVSALFKRLAWEDLAAFEVRPFDGVLSNFGGLNCVSDLRSIADALAAKLRPGGMALLCIMGPAVPWEWIWFLAKGNPHAAFRRLRRGGAEWSGIAVNYPSIAKAREAFAADFRVLRVSALGVLLPPPYTENWIGRFPRVIGALNRVERLVETSWPLPMLADHYLMELQRN